MSVIEPEINSCVLLESWCGYTSNFGPKSHFGVSHILGPRESMTKMFIRDKIRSRVSLYHKSGCNHVFLNCSRVIMDHDD